MWLQSACPQGERGLIWGFHSLEWHRVSQLNRFSADIRQGSSVKRSTSWKVCLISTIRSCAFFSPSHISTGLCPKLTKNEKRYAPRHIDIQELLHAPLGSFLLCSPFQLKGVGSITMSQKRDTKWSLMMCGLIRLLRFLFIFTCYTDREANFILGPSTHVVLLGLHKEPARKASLVSFDSWGNWSLEAEWLPPDPKLLTGHRNSTLWDSNCIVLLNISQQPPRWLHWLLSSCILWPHCLGMDSFQRLMIQSGNISWGSWDKSGPSLNSGVREWSSCLKDHTGLE